MRLIDADGLDVIGYTGTDGRPNTFDDGVIWTLEKIDAMPTIDAVPVARCRDCRYSIPIVDAITHERNGLWCALLDLENVEENFYCKDGERRENGET